MLAITDQARTTARTMWHLLEPVHAVTYFAPETTEAYKALGLKGFWQGYFALRAAPLGPVSGDVCRALFYNFQPDMVQRALPSAWAIASPEVLMSTREVALRPVLTAMLGDQPGVAEAADLAAIALEGCAPEGRTLFAGHLSIPQPQDPVMRLWWAATLLREHRGDGHVATLMVHGLDGLESHVLFAATGRVPRELMQVARSWSDEEWDLAEQRLTVRGLLEAGRLTDAGTRLRDRVEESTDELATGPWIRLGEERTNRLAELLKPMREKVLATGRIPFFNPIGLPIGDLD